jgi:hypothetical protein
VYTILLFLFRASVPHVIAAQFLVLNECTTLHRTNAPGQVKVKRKAVQIFCVSRSRLFLSSCVSFPHYTLYTYYFAWSLASLHGVRLRPCQEMARAKSPEEQTLMNSKKHTQNHQPAHRCWIREHS